MLIPQNLMKNVQKNLLIIYLFKTLFLPPFQNWNLCYQYLGNICSITKKRLKRCISKRLNFCKLKIIFETGNRLKNYFRFKDLVPETLQSNFIYKFKCGSCIASYYSKIYRHMKVRVSEHQGVSPRTSKRVKGTSCASVGSHMTTCLIVTRQQPGQISLSLVES